MKSFSIIVTGQPNHIKRCISCISYGPENLITHQFQVQGSQKTKEVQMNFGSLQVDEDNRIDFFGGNDDVLYEFIEERPETGYKGVILIVNADDPAACNELKSTLMKRIPYLKKLAMVIGVTGDEYESVKLVAEQVRSDLASLNTLAPVLSVDPDNKEDVSLLVETLLCLAHPGISETLQGKSKFVLNDDI